MIPLGKVKPGSTIFLPWESFASSTGAPITMTGLAVGDVLIYKDGGTTQRASTNGITLLDTDGTDFDGQTGLHGISIDLSDNSTADFYAAGSKYMVAIGDVTVDSQTMRFWGAIFEIGYPDAILDTTIATLASQTSFTLTAGPADNDALNGCVCVVHDAASAVQIAQAVVSDYVGSTKTVTLATDPGIFTMSAKDNISFFRKADLGSVLGTTLTEGAVGRLAAAVVKFFNVASPTGTVNSLPDHAITTGTVSADAGNTSSTFKTSLSQTATDHWKYAFLTFTSGALAGQTRQVTGYNGSTKFVTTVAFSAAPSTSDAFLLVNR